MDRLDELNQELCSLYLIHASVSAEERRCKVNTLWECLAQGWNASQAKIEADHEALPYTRDLMKVEGRIRALEQEQRHLHIGGTVAKPVPLGNWALEMEYA